MWTSFLQWLRWRSLPGRGLLPGRRSHHSQCAGAEGKRVSDWLVNNYSSSFLEKTSQYLPDDALDELVHRERDVSVNGEHFPQRVLVLRCFHVAIQQIPNHLQESRVVIFHLNVHWREEIFNKNRSLSGTARGEKTFPLFVTKTTGEFFLNLHVTDILLFLQSQHIRLTTDLNILHVIFKALHGLEIYWKCSPCNQSTACRLFPPQAKRR